MPSLISNAVGTQRQFTAQPDAVYQGRYREVGASQASASTSSALELGQNMERLSQAFQSYKTQHEKYLDSKGLREAQHMIANESPEAIEKLNAIDAAQAEGYVESLDNPYFKAYAEKLRGQFLSNRMRGEFDVLAQENPEWKKTPEELAKQYAKFAKDWKKEHTLSAVNELAFDTGYQENNVNEMTTLMGEWYKNKKQEDITITTTQIANNLDDVLMHAGEFIKNEDMEGLQKSIQEALNPARLMGLPLETRIKLVKDFVTRGVSSMSFNLEVIDKALPNVVLQTTSDGQTMKLSDLMSIKDLHTDAVSRLSQYNNDLKEQFMLQYQGDYDGALADLEEAKYTDPDRYLALASTLPQIKAEQERIQREAEAELKRAQKAAAKGQYGGGGRRRSYGGGGRRYYRSRGRKNPDGTIGAYGGKKLRTTDDVNEWMQGVISGQSMINGLPASAYSVTPEVFYPAFENEVKYLTANRKWDLLYRLMNTTQAGTMKKDIARDMQMELNTLRVDDNTGRVEIDGKVKTLLDAYVQNPLAARDIFGKALGDDAQVLSTFVAANPTDMQQAFTDYVNYRRMDEGTKKELENRVAKAGNSYTLEGVENLDGGTSTVAIDEMTRQAFLNNACAYAYTTGDINEALNMVGAQMAQGYFQWRGGMIPKYVLNNIGTANDRQNFLDSLGDDMAIQKEDGTSYVPDTCTVRYDPINRIFFFKDPAHKHLIGGHWVHSWQKSEGYIKEKAHVMPEWKAKWAEVEETNQRVIDEQIAAERAAMEAEERAYRESLYENAVDLARNGSMEEIMNNVQEMADSVNSEIPNRANDIPYTGNTWSQYYTNDGLQPDADDDDFVREAYVNGD